MSTIPTHTIEQSEISFDITQVDHSHNVTVSELVLPDEGYVTSNVVDEIITLTQAAYNAIPVPDPRILYVIIT